MGPWHVECACVRCLACGGDIPADQTDYDFTLLVSVKLADDATFDCVLALHEDCAVALTEAGMELMNVKALGRALMLATECIARQRESKSQAPRSGSSAPHAAGTSR